MAELVEKHTHKTVVWVVIINRKKTPLIRINGSVSGETYKQDNPLSYVIPFTLSPRNNFNAR